MSRARNTRRSRHKASLDQENEDIERYFDLGGAQGSQGAVLANDNTNNEYQHEEENKDPDVNNGSGDDGGGDVEESSEEESEPRDESNSRPSGTRWSASVFVTNMLFRRIKPNMRTLVLLAVDCNMETGVA